MKNLRPVVLASFFFTGVCWVVLALAWTRAVGIIVGNSAAALNVIMLSLLGGIAVGAWWGGKRAMADVIPFRRIGMLEAGAALSAFLATLLLRAPAFTGALEAQAVYAGGLLFIPSALLGAAIVTLLRTLAVLPSAGVGDVGKSLALALAGAFVGTLAGGLLLMPVLGMFLTAVVAAGLMMTVSTVFLVSGKDLRPSDPPDRPQGPELHRYVFPALAAATGISVVLFSVAWGRATAISFGPTVYATTLTLAAILLGLFVGCAITCSRAMKSGDPLASLGFILGGGALLALGLGHYLGELPLQMVEIACKFQDHFGSLLAVQSLLLVVFISFPAALSGASMPYLWRLARGGGRFEGSLLGWIAAGCAFGTVPATMLLANVGVSMTLASAVSICCVAGTALFLMRRPPWIWYATACILPLIGSWMLKGWDPQIISSGPYLYAKNLRRFSEVSGRDLRTVVKSSSKIMREYRDDRGHLAVHSFANGILRLRLNGKTEASSHIQFKFSRSLLGHLPLIHCARARSVFILGLGNGDTLGAAAAYPELERIEVTGNSLSSLLAAHHFERCRTVLLDPRVKSFVGDARFILVNSPGPYDVIISTPSDLWVDSSARLYTREFYENAKARLEPHGILAQRVNSKHLSPADLRSVFRTFFETFKAGSVWEVIPGRDYILLGALSASPASFTLLEERLQRPRITTDLEPYGIDSPRMLLRHLLMNRERALAYAGNAPILTDDLNRVEYRVPRTFHSSAAPPILDALAGFRSEPVETGLYRDLPSDCGLEKDRRAQLALAVKAAEEEKPLEALALIDALRDASGNLDPISESLYSEAYGKIHGEASRLRCCGEVDKAIATFLSIPETSSCYGKVCSRVAYLYSETGLFDKAREYYERAIAASPDLRDGYMGLTLLEENLGQWEAAAEGWVRYLRLFPEDSAFYANLARVYFKMGMEDEALEVARKGLAVDPDNDMLRSIVEP